MLGIPDPGIWIALLLCVLSAILCVAYGAMNWNADADVDPEDPKWAMEEKQIEEEF